MLDEIDQAKFAKNPNKSEKEDILQLLKSYKKTSIKQLIHLIYIMSTTADIRNGAVINFKNARMKIVEFQHVKPGKGPAFVRTKLKDIQSENY